MPVCVSQLIQQHDVAFHAVYKVCSGNFWSICLEEIQSFEQSHAQRNRLLRSILWLDDILWPEWYQKTFIKNRTSLLEKNCFTYHQLFHPVQCNAWKILQCKSRDTILYKRACSILSALLPIPNPSKNCCFVIGIQQCATIFYQTVISCTLFSNHCILSTLGKKNHLRISPFSVWHLLHLSTDSLIFREKICTLGVQRDRVPNTISTWKRSFLSPMFPLNLTRTKKLKSEKLLLLL